MPSHAWVNEFPFAITVCDPDGIILEMNEKSARTFQNDGGVDLIGKNLFDCHPEPAKNHLEDLMRNRQTNVYTIEKKGGKKMIYQSPWFENGEYKEIGRASCRERV